MGIMEDKASVVRPELSKGATNNASPAANAPEISIDNSSTSLAHAPPTFLPTSAGSGLSGKRPRPEEAMSETPAKKLRTEAAVAPVKDTALTAVQSLTNTAPVKAIKKVTATAENMTTASEPRKIKSVVKNESPSKMLKSEKTVSDVTATGGTSDANSPKGANAASGKVEKGTKPVQTKTNSSANDVKTSPRASPRAFPRAPIPEPEEEKPLDLAAIRQFEYDRVSTFGPMQQKRYESYRRSDLKKEKVKKLLVALNPSLAKGSDQYLIAVKGLAKVFVGDVVETALEVKSQLGDTGALQPKHLREAYRRLRRNGALPSSNAGPSALE